MNGFTFQTPPKIVFNWGAVAQLPAETGVLGQCPLVVCGRSLRASGKLEAVLAGLRQAGLDPAVHEGVPAEPDLTALQACMDAAAGCDSVIAIGGGSVLDIAKGGAALSDTGATAAEYFAGKPVPDTGKPLIAVPTTSGTGSEVTWVCVLVDHETRRKASIRGPGMMPRVAIVDPELTVSCPPTVTAYSGADAFVQAVEAYTSRGANPMTDALALEAARLTARWLREAVREPENQEAREGMALGSMMAGIALNTSRLGLVHGLAHPLGAVTGAPHGLLCGLLLPPVMRFNRSVAGAKYVALAVALGVEPPKDFQFASGQSFLDLHIDGVIEFTENLFRRVGIPLHLSALDFDLADLDWVAQETMPSGSTKANPRTVTVADARAVTESCL